MALAVWWLAARALQPAAAGGGRRARARRAVAAAARRRDGLPDEVAPLVHALNALLQRLGASLDTQRAFVADAAHELRSPLTALKLQLQLLRRAPDEAARQAAVEASGRRHRPRGAPGRAAADAGAQRARAQRRACVERVELGELVRAARSRDLHAYAQSRGSELVLRSRSAGRDRGRAQRTRGARAQPGRQRAALFAGRLAGRGAGAPRRRCGAARGRRRRTRHPAGRAGARVRPLLSPAPAPASPAAVSGWRSCAAWRSVMARRCR